MATTARTISAEGRVISMTLKDFAQMINGKNYDLPMFSKEEIAIA